MNWNRKDSFITHRAFCDALAEESARFVSVPPAAAAPAPAYLNNVVDAEVNTNHQHLLVNTTSSSQLDQSGFNISRNNINSFLGETFKNQHALPTNVFASSSSPSPRSASDLQNLWQLQRQSSHQWLLNENNNNNNILQRGISKNQEEYETKKGITNGSLFSSEARNNTSSYSQNGGQVIGTMSATALLQKAAQMGSKRSSSSSNNSTGFGLMSSSIFNNKQTENNIKTKEVDERGFTRDFLGVGSQHRPWPLLMVNHNIPDSSPPPTTYDTPTADMNH